mmetsp:Transcript_51958/g.121168  ORF Transcript_51958/g.121168 Transcript_51958/m.121168 type:complete len:284 (-) Transcript_51958:329-1180(-)
MGVVAVEICKGVTVDAIERTIHEALAVAHASGGAGRPEEVLDVLGFVVCQAALAYRLTRRWLRLQSILPAAQVANHPVPVSAIVLWVLFVSSGTRHHCRRKLITRVGDGSLANLPLVLMLGRHKHLVVPAVRDVDSALRGNLHNDAHGAPGLLPHVPQIKWISDSRRALLDVLDVCQELSHPVAELAFDLVVRLLLLRLLDAVFHSRQTLGFELMVLRPQELSIREVHLLCSLLQVGSEGLGEGHVRCEVRKFGYFRLRLLTEVSKRRLKLLPQQPLSQRCEQ